MSFLPLLASVVAIQSPRLDWEFPLGGAPLGVGVCQGHLVVAQKESGVMVLRLEPETKPPTEVGLVPRRQLAMLEAMNLQVVGKRAFVALGNHFAAGGSKFGLAIVDLQQVGQPRVVGLWISDQKGGGATDVVVQGNTAYVAAMAEGVAILDVTDPSAPKLQRKLRLDPNFPRKNPNSIARPNARGLAISENRLYVANDAGGLRIVDLKSGKEVGKYVNPKMGHKQQAYNNVVVEGDLAYLATDYAGLEIVDVSKPESIKQVGWWNPWKADLPTNMWFQSPGHTNQLSLDPEHRTVYLSSGDSELQVVDVSDPQHPVAKPSYGAFKDGMGAWGLTRSGDTLYLTYIKALIPFLGKWSGIKALRLR